MKTYKTQNGLELLTEWQNYPEQLKKAKHAARQIVDHLIFEKNRAGFNIDDIFGLPYTSTSNFAAIWNTNTQAYFMDDENKNKLYFDGVALDINNNPVYVYTEFNENNEEIDTRFIAAPINTRDYMLSILDKQFDCYMQDIENLEADDAEIQCAYYHGLLDAANIFISDGYTKKIAIERHGGKHIIKRSYKK